MKASLKMMSVPKDLRLHVSPLDMRTIDPVSARDIASGRFVMAGISREYGINNPFVDITPDMAWQKALHSFVWLRHLRALDSASANTIARKLTRDWIKHKNTYPRFVFEPDIAMRRLFAMLAHYPLIIDDPNDEFYQTFIENMMLESTKLQLSAQKTTNPYWCLQIWITLLIQSLCIQEKLETTFYKQYQLISAIARFTIEDGSLDTRNAHHALELISLMLPLRQLYQVLNIGIPNEFNLFIDNLARFLSFMRLPDGSLSRFHGVGATPIDLLSKTLASLPTIYHDKITQTLAGYNKVSAPFLTLLADTGEKPPQESSNFWLGPPLSYEVGENTGSIIVNSGVRYDGLHFSYKDENPNLKTALLIKNQNPQSDFEISMQQHTITSELIKLSAQYYALSSPSLSHYRSWELNLKKHNLEIIDILKSTTEKTENIQIEMRIILHPSIIVSERPRSYVLTTQSGSKWRLTTKGYKLILDKSVYHSIPEGNRPTLSFLAKQEITTGKNYCVSLRKINSDD